MSITWLPTVMEPRVDAVGATNAFTSPHASATSASVSVGPCATASPLAGSIAVVTHRYASNGGVAGQVLVMIGSETTPSDQYSNRSMCPAVEEFGATNARTRPQRHCWSGSEPVPIGPSGALMPPQTHCGEPIVIGNALFARTPDGRTYVCDPISNLPSAVAVGATKPRTRPHAVVPTRFTQSDDAIGVGVGTSACVAVAVGAVGDDQVPHATTKASAHNTAAARMTLTSALRLEARRRIAATKAVLHRPPGTEHIGDPADRVVATGPHVQMRAVGRPPDEPHEGQVAQRAWCDARLDQGDRWRPRRRDVVERRAKDRDLPGVRARDRIAGGLIGARCEHRRARSRLRVVARHRRRSARGGLYGPH